MVEFEMTTPAPDKSPDEHLSILKAEKTTLTSFIEITQKIKELETLKDELAERLTKAFQEHNITTVKTASGTLSLVERTSWEHSASCKMTLDYLKLESDRAKESDIDLGYAKEKTSFHMRFQSI